jgi:predicted dehydrogenase
MAALLADVDIVDICTHTPAHKEGVLAAAAAGKPVMCEKPLASHLPDAQEMVDTCVAAGVPRFVAHVVRFFPQCAQAKALLASGQLGRPGVIRTIRGGSPPRATSDTWYSDLSASGGVIMDVSIHDIDYVRWCFGEVERVFARGLTFANEAGKDPALITLRFATGAIGHIEGSWAFPPGQVHTRLEIAGDQGIVEWDSQKDQPVQAALRTAPDSSEVNRTTLSPLAPHDDPYHREMAHFLECLDNGKPFLVTPHDALMAVKVALAAIESMRRGEPVTVADFEEAVVG